MTKKSLIKRQEKRNGKRLLDIQAIMNTVKLNGLICTGLLCRVSRIWGYPDN